MSPSRVGAFERQKQRMRSILKESTYQPISKLSEYLFLPEASKDDTSQQQQQGQQPFVSIVWHVRVGDIVINNHKEYFETIAAQIADSFRSIPQARIPKPHVFFMGEGGKDHILESYDFLPDICAQYFEGGCSYPDMSVEETFYHMIYSDILVTTGSSFPAVAAMLRSNGITLASMPKEGIESWQKKGREAASSSAEIYGVSENLDIGIDGFIPEIEELTAFLETLSKDHPYDR